MLTEMQQQLRTPFLLLEQLPTQHLQGLFLRLYLSILDSSVLWLRPSLLLPIPLSACLAAFSVTVVRSEEADDGIRVFDSNGNAVGVSKAVGSKAIKETALSRVTLFGTTAAFPTLLLALLKRAKFVQRNPMIIAPVWHISTAIIFGLMIPVSFSLFPQFGKIKEDLEEFQSLDGNSELFYHRGL